MSLTITRLTIWLALISYTVALFLLRRAQVEDGAKQTGNPSDKSIAHSRFWLTAGLGLYFIHILAAFHEHYSWSHSVAVEQTTKQTEEATGLPIWIGLYVNYFFTITWVLEVALWFRVGDASYFRSISRLRFWLFHGFAVFMVANGAVLFVPNWLRFFGLGLLICQLILLLQIRLYRKRTGDEAGATDIPSS